MKSMYTEGEEVLTKITLKKWEYNESLPLDMFECHEVGNSTLFIQSVCMKIKNVINNFAFSLCEISYIYSLFPPLPLKSNIEGKPNIMSAIAKNFFLLCWAVYFFNHEVLQQW